MKNYTLNQPFHLLFYKIFFFNKNHKLALKILISFLVLLTYESSLAQVTNNAKEVSTFLGSLKITSASEYENARGLLYDLNQAIYTYNNTLNIYGENCTVLYSDMASLNYIKNSSISSNSIEMVKINIAKTTDLREKIDLSIFSNFPNLKYIYLFSTIESTENALNQMCKNYDSKYTLIYSINLGE